MKRTFLWILLAAACVNTGEAFREGARLGGDAEQQAPVVRAPLSYAACAATYVQAMDATMRAAHQGEDAQFWAGFLEADQAEATAIVGHVPSLHIEVYPLTAFATLVGYYNARKQQQGIDAIPVLEGLTLAWLRHRQYIQPVWNIIVSRVMVEVNA